jgi:hypothetical protein
MEAQPWENVSHRQWSIVIASDTKCITKEIFIRSFAGIF